MHLTVQLIALEYTFTMLDYNLRNIWVKNFCHLIVDLLSLLSFQSNTMFSSSSLTE